jgi:hypothetical protein
MSYPNFKYIVTHHGHAHRDEFIAICLLLSELKQNLTIFRESPKPEQLTDHLVIVVDVGETMDVGLANLDHHQLPRDAEATCSITQVLTFLGYDLAYVREVWPWLEYAEYIDSKGPGATCKRFGIPSENLIRGMSPVEAALIHQFQERTLVTPDDSLWKTMKLIGDGSMSYLHDVTRRLVQLKTNAKFETLGNVKVMVNDFIAASEHPALGVELFLRREQLEKEIDVVISQDEREPGLSLFRRNDSKKIDFSKIEKEAGVRFAHKVGFIAKTEPGVNWRDLVIKATVEI